MHGENPINVILAVQRVHRVGHHPLFLPPRAARASGDRGEVRRCESPRSSQPKGAFIRRERERQKETE